MQYNHGKAWREFRKQWKEKERQYRQSGMTDYQINKIYAYDLMMFRSDRRFYEHCVDIQSEEYNEKLAVTDEYFRHDVETWIEALDESIKKELKKRPKDAVSFSNDSEKRKTSVSPFSCSPPHFRLKLHQTGLRCEGIERTSGA